MKKIIATLLLLATILVLVVATTSCGGTKYEITFDANGGTIDGSETKVITVKEGSKLTAPNAVKDGYTVSGWYATKQASSKWNFDTDVVTESITLTAWWAKGSASGGNSGSCEHEFVETRLEDWSEATCTKNGKQYFKCTKCGEVFDVFKEINLPEDLLPEGFVISKMQTNLWGLCANCN